jgi:enoyl-CoA hydratase
MNADPEAIQPEVLVETVDAVLVITINRPHARNAVTQAVSRLVADALDRLEADDHVMVGVLTGAGGNFCAGMDLKAFAFGQRPEIDGQGFAGVTERRLRKPLIAAVEGFALAGGCEVVLACDLVVAAQNAVFGIPEVTRGLVAGAGGLIRLPRKIPSAIAMELALTGNRFSAIDARQWGLVNRIVRPGQALQGALELATRITANAPLAVQLTKRIMTDAPTWPAEEVWDRQRPLVDEIAASQDAHEGAVAFAEKRSPNWVGR